MTLTKFIETYDVENAIVLLEGKRKILSGEPELLTQLGKMLAEKTTKMKFRSGNADGSDHYFSLGVAAVDKSRLQVITPYSGHRKKYNQAAESISLDTINLASEPEVVYQSKSQKNKNIVDRYVSGERDRFSIKAAYLIRDTIKVLGTKTIPPATFAIFYDDLQKPKTGGTGHTMNVCEQNNIPMIDQSVWFQWLEKESENSSKQ